MSIVLENITKSFRGRTVLNNLSLTVKKGEFHVILGPNGEGKSTLLAVISGLIQPDKGNIILENRRVNGVPPEKRDIGFVFQDYALFPHMPVYENVAYGLRAKGLKEATIKERTKRYLKLARLDDLQNFYPKQLSGGQKQRVGVARALATEPTALLLDEPLSHLDAIERERLRDELKRIQKETKATVCYVTHEQTEAMALADRVSVLHRGCIEQVESPDDIFYRPKTPFVANFVGATNILNVSLARLNRDTATFNIKGPKLAKPIEIKAKKYPVFADKKEHALCLHPEKVTLAQRSNGSNSLPARIVKIVPQGAILKVTCDISGLTLQAVVPKTAFNLNLKTDHIWFCFPPDALHPLCGRTCRAAKHLRACSIVSRQISNVG